MTLHVTLQELYNCLTDALVEYTYDTLWFGKAQAICKLRQLSPDRLGWSGLDLDSLQPRILACYGPPCKTIAPWKHFWAKAMQELPQHLALRVELGNECWQQASHEGLPCYARYVMHTAMLAPYKLYQTCCTPLHVQLNAGLGPATAYQDYCTTE